MFELPISEASPDFASLAAQRVPGSNPQIAVGRHPLDEHIRGLEREFAGAPAIGLYHAILIVLIRRDMQRELALRQFQKLWSQHEGAMLTHLSARWLVAACDTLMDHSTDKSERAIAALGSTLVNTVKLYETERRLIRDASDAYSTLLHPVDLFDGLTSFSVGQGDMIQNLRTRTKAICGGNTPASKIVLELMKRMDRPETVYGRFAAAHLNDETRWFD